MSQTSSRTTEFLFFGGKGGVGKTTCAAAHAILAARAGQRVLAVSTDPAHSLGDALGVRLSPRPRAVTSRLSAAELDAPGAFRRWLAAHRRPLGEILEHGTWLERSDVDALLDLSLPGIDELVALLEILRLAGEPAGPTRRFDLIVVDTAPTGHTLRLLAAPQTVGAVAHLLDVLEEPHRIVLNQLARVRGSEAADRLIAEIEAHARDAGDLLRDRARASFAWITLPEALSLAESADAVAALEAREVSVATLVINRVLPSGPPCANCDPRRAEERRTIARARKTLGRTRRVRLCAALPQEPRGIAALARVGSTPAKSQGQRAIMSEPLALSPLPSANPPRSVPYQDLIGSSRLLFFGGKGGVGKTTVAAAVALRLARAEPSQDVLLLSTDPAHSLSDVLDAAVTDRAGPVDGAPRNLRVREVDAVRALAVRRKDLESAVERISGGFAVPGLAGSAGGGLRELMKLAPPGIDELFSLLEIARVGDTREIIVIDTAPTGHAIRLLEMPALAREWMQLLMRMLLKYRDLVRPGPLGTQLLELSQSIGALQELLRDRSRTRFIVVSRAAAVPRMETARLLERLRRLKLHVPAIVMNALTIDPGRCPWCRRVAAAERREITALQAACRRQERRCAIIPAPLAAPPPRGISALERWAHAWLS